MVKTICICDMCGKDLVGEPYWEVNVRSHGTLQIEREEIDLCPQCNTALMKYVKGYWKIEKLHSMVEADPTPSDHHQSHETETED